MVIAYRRILQRGGLLRVWTEELWQERRFPDSSLFPSTADIAPASSFAPISKCHLVVLTSKPRHVGAKANELAFRVRLKSLARKRHSEPMRVELRSVAKGAKFRFVRRVGFFVLSSVLRWRKS